MQMPVEQIKPGQRILLPNGVRRTVVQIERSDHIGLEENVDAYRVIYDTTERTRLRDGFESEPVLQALAVKRAGECWEVVAGE